MGNVHLRSAPLAFDEAPMTRGIISKINGISAKEFAGEHWVLSGDRGITYSTAPLERSKITEGVWWEPEYKGPAQISFSDEEVSLAKITISEGPAIASIPTVPNNCLFASAT